jgi:nitrate/TMAO reductase-like tetraheme cytochrome c subunit
MIAYSKSRWHRVAITLGAVMLMFLGFTAWQADPPALATPPANWNAAKLAKESNCKICHSKATIGNQWGAWESSPHGEAFKSLGTPKAKEVAAKFGIEDPTTSPNCLQCHSTAYGFSDHKVTANIQVAEGVTCQSCHGPGEDYKSKTKHADNPKEAMEKYGLVKPTEANTCSLCHNQRNPTYNPARYTTKDGRQVDFDYDQAVEKIKHSLKK